ncbi:MAG TPA: hypothetical protein VHG91_03060 [Longimicrobium sp.]|nr:hypothetical protein [Longimicrobium sp.]
MQRLTRLLGGCLLGVALLVAGQFLAPGSTSAQTEIKLTCTSTTCCTYYANTGVLISCVPIKK